ncbi:MAG: hypothetical protein ACHQT8_00530 [Chlamydiales bacterium]
MSISALISSTSPETPPNIQTNLDEAGATHSVNFHDESSIESANVHVAANAGGVPFSLDVKTPGGHLVTPEDFPELVHAVPTYAQPMQTESPAGRKSPKLNPALPIPVPSVENGDGSSSPVAPASTEEIARRAVAAATHVAAAAASVAGTGGSAAPAVVLTAPVEPNAASSAVNPRPPAPSSRRWIPAFVGNFFSWLLDLLLCRCFSRSRAPNPPTSGSSESSNSARGVELRPMGLETASAHARVDSVNQARPEIVQEMTAQIRHAFDTELKTLKDLEYPYKKIALFMGTTGGKNISFGYEERINDEESCVYQESLEQRKPSALQISRLITFKMAFITIREVSSQLHANFQIYTYNPRNPGQAKHEHHDCSSVEEFIAFLKNEKHDEFFDTWVTAKDYTLDLVSEEEPTVSYNEDAANTSKTAEPAAASS